MKKTVKRTAYQTLQRLGVLPSVWMLRNPIKIHEYLEVVRGAGLEGSHDALDIGCGKGFQTQILARRCRRILGVDVSPSQISEARKFLAGSRVERKTEFRQGRLQDLGLPAESLDRVLSFCVLEHIPELDIVLAEVARLLRPGGELHVSVDSLGTIRDESLIAKHRSDHFVHQYFTVETLPKQLAAAGLEPLEIRPILTGPTARVWFEERIRSNQPQASFVERMRLFRRFRDEDRKAGASAREGIMIVGRARKPAASSASASPSGGPSGS